MDTVPKYPQNACKIFSRKLSYGINLQKRVQKYYTDVPIHIILAFVNKESGFNQMGQTSKEKNYLK